MSRWSEIIALAITRMRPRDIAIETGTSISHVYRIISAARRDGADIPKFNTGAGLDQTRAYLSSQTVAALTPHAVRRDLTVSQLAREVIDTVVEEGLIDAVLDD